MAESERLKDGNRENTKESKRRERCTMPLEEADESELWLEIAAERRIGDSPKCSWLLDESGQLRSIFSKGCMTARSREGRKR
jgi:hypothetical protein